MKKVSNNLGLDIAVLGVGDSQKRLFAYLGLTNTVAALLVI
jgi:hypothetical protein